MSQAGVPGIQGAAREKSTQQGGQLGKELERKDLENKTRAADDQLDPRGEPGRGRGRRKV